MSGRSATRVALAATALAVVLRALWLDRLPGLNGDEAWYGVNLQAIMSGQPGFWTTPSGNPLNPLHSGPLAVLLLLFGPAPWVLRAPETLWSIAAVAAAFPLLRGSIGVRAASITALLLAASPVATVYGRLGWDPSGDIFITLIGMAAALGDRPVLATIAGALGLVVHPTNVFFLPILAAAWTPHAIRRYRASNERQRRVTAIALGAGAVAGGIALLFALRSIAANPATPLPSIALAVARATSPADWWQFAVRVLRFTSGTSTMAFVAGPSPGLIPEATAGLAGAAIAGLLIRRIATGDGDQAWLGAGTLLALALFMVAGGPAEVQPGLDRYALFLLVPLTIITALAVDVVPASFAATATGLIVAAMLIVSAQGFFLPMLKHGGDGHVAFRTGDTEPKRAAADFIRAHASGSTIVMCDDWWSYWPLRFLLHDQGRISVGLMPTASFPPGVRERLPAIPAGADAIYAVLFEGDPQAARYGTPLFTSRDPGGRVILNVFRAN